MNTITIDCGASFIKGAVFEEGKQVMTVSRTAPFSGRNSEIFSAHHIFRLVEVVRNMITELAGREKEVVLCVSNEMHGFLLTETDGNPLTDYISWQMDLGNIFRSEETHISAIFERDVLRDDICRSGMPLRAGLPSTNLCWLLQSGQLPAVKDLKFYTLGSYLLKVLSGGREPQEHLTNAAATGLFDLVNGDWNHHFIEEIGAERVVMPVVGSEMIHFKFNGMVIHALPAIGDQQAALLGAGLSDVNDLSFNLGTGAQVSRLVQELTFSNDCQTRPYFHGKYIKTIPHIPSGRALNVYVRFVKSILEQYGVALDDDTVWEGIIQAAGNCRDTRLPQIDLSFFPNAMREDSSEGGKITGIDEYAFSFGNLMRAVMERMADNFTEAADRIAPQPLAVKKLIFSGGIARRLDLVRKRVMDHYPEVPFSVSSNETMEGLYLYSRDTFR